MKIRDLRFLNTALILGEMTEQGRKKVCSGDPEIKKGLTI